MRTWTYWRVYAPPASMDDVVLGLEAMVERAAGAGADWHFLRYADLGGAHVRFRALTTPSIADALHAARKETGHPVRADLYEPEVHKWGAGGVVAAEEVFTASTLLAAHAIRERADVAGRVLRHTLSALVPDERIRRAVLRTHAAWWMGDLDPQGGQVERELAALRDGPPPSTSDREPVPDGLLERFVAVLAEAMRAAGPEHPPTYHLHQHVHLTMNRLGLDSRAEAGTALRELVRLEETGDDQR